MGRGYGDFRNYFKGGFRGVLAGVAGWFWGIFSPLGVNFSYFPGYLAGMPASMSRDGEVGHRATGPVSGVKFGGGWGHRPKGRDVLWHRTSICHPGFEVAL